MIKACIFDLDGTLADTLDSMAYVTHVPFHPVLLTVPVIITVIFLLTSFSSFYASEQLHTSTPLSWKTSRSRFRTSSCVTPFFSTT